VCVGGGGGVGFGSNGFVTKMQPLLMDGHYRTNVISGVGHPRSDSVIPLVLHTVYYAMAGAPTLYYRSIETASTLLRIGNISVNHTVELLLLLMIISIYYIICIIFLINCHFIILHVLINNLLHH
jgi:hypothetical protein